MTSKQLDDAPSGDAPLAGTTPLDGTVRLDDMLCFALYSTAHAVNRVYKPVLKALDLTYPQYLAMLTLWERDGRTVKEIGDLLQLDSGTLTPLLKRLEAIGLLIRQRDTADERQVRISLTPKGAALRARANIVPREMLRASNRSMDELARLKKELAALRDQLNAAVS